MVWTGHYGTNGGTGYDANATSRTLIAQTIGDIEYHAAYHLIAICMRFCIKPNLEVSQFIIVDSGPI